MYDRRIPLETSHVSYMRVESCCLRFAPSDLFLLAASEALLHSCHVKTWNLLAAFFLTAAIAFGDDFKTTDGKEYKNVAVSRVEPDGIVLTSSSGISKVYFTELPREVQERFHYDSAKASAYSAEQAKNYAAFQKKQEEVQTKREESAAKNNQYLAEQESARESAKSQRDKLQALQPLEARYKELQKQEDALLLQIGEAERRPRRDSFRSQIPFLESHLDDVRHEKNRIRGQLEQAQRQ